MTCNEPAITQPYWDLFNHLFSVLAEAANASVLHRQDPATVLYGPGHPLVDTHGASKDVDAKSSWPDPRGLGFMGSARPQEVRLGVTHYGLTLGTGWARAVTAPCGGVDVSAHLDPDVYLVPASIINKFARRATLRDGTPGSGLNLYLPMQHAQRYHTV